MHFALGTTLNGFVRNSPVTNSYRLLSLCQQITRDIYFTTQKILSLFYYVLVNLFSFHRKT